ncbi:Myosin heavy chain 95F [Chionoecetes opilio]|uniref:Myosin heavy chain 95F n=1 Tax=Chionoecetes opilio TaxID=41210 RepID=A0A8J4Y982_CHIOP|nr:Myosin heavy chain 95F [Chionoecetes opilio]
MPYSVARAPKKIQLENTQKPQPPLIQPPPLPLPLLQYLKKGCTQYFCGKNTEKTLGSSRKSPVHLKKGPLKDPMLDDVRDFASVDKALGNFGLSEGERLAVYTTVAAVLHLGNVGFEDNPTIPKVGAWCPRGVRATCRRPPHS